MLSGLELYPRWVPLSVNIFLARGRQNMVKLLFVSSETETALHEQLVFAKISKLIPRQFLLKLPHLLISKRRS